MKKYTRQIIFLVIAVILIIAITLIAQQEDTVPSTNTTTSTTTVATSSGAMTTDKSYSISEVATHSTQASCWTTIRGNVYDVTTWINKHPGGAQAILSLCGKDGAAFVAKHAGQAQPEAMLASFKIGVLK